MLNLNTPLLLASASPRRKSLLQMLQLDFIVESPFCEEKITHSLPHAIVEDLALQKVQFVILL